MSSPDRPILELPEVQKYAPGQRWTSETQPELGLGLILTAEGARLSVLFPAVAQTFQFAVSTAPLRRVAFGEGDRVEDHEGNDFIVTGHRIEGGCLIYLGDGGEELPEAQLSDTVSFGSPAQRLLAGNSDRFSGWKLRQRVLRNQHRRHIHPLSGLLGGRISRIPHQLYIAQEVAKRFAPRVLLADEVGLGKTIEACLILHRMLISGRVSRALIVVPEPLVHQWFVELLRRFHLRFSIFDEERAESIEANNPDVNPFLDDQLVLCSIDWLSSHPERRDQAVDAGWDISIFDEAHHLRWKDGKAEPAYEVAEKIATASPALLLLTGTPEQLGPDGHFARLRLLDPDRFSDPAAFVEEAKRYGEISDIAEKVQSSDPLTNSDVKEIRTLLGADDDAFDISEGDLDSTTRATIRRSLLDLHGTGRVLFRNRRAALGGFPDRHLELAPLPEGETSFRAKTRWIIGLLEDVPDEKFILICKTREMVEQISERLAEHLPSKITTEFHEGLTLMQRDRNAAWFADTDGDARILLCSEIGSEGRNFQFAHHLILFDLPDSPGLLEQRIGRLDRIGQTEDIIIHVPYLIGSDEEVAVTYLNEGLDAFSTSQAGAEIIHREFQDKLDGISLDDLTDLLPEIISRREEVETELSEGRDRLLEMSSFDPAIASRLSEFVYEEDDDGTLEKLFTDLCEHFGASTEPLGERTYVLQIESLTDTSAFPDLPDEGATVTFDRERALEREDYWFVTWDHPLITAAIERLLATGHGSTACLHVPAGDRASILMEAVYVLECVAPKHLHAGRYLPPQPVRIMVDHGGAAQASGRTGLPSETRALPGEWIQKRGSKLRPLIDQLMEKADVCAESQANMRRHDAILAMKEESDDTLARLHQLKEMGHSVREEEIKMAENARAELEEHLAGGRLRLDSMRLIVTGSAG